jgi:hypothetical protein
MENNGQLLNIQYATSNDSGLYQCTASNTVGQDTRTVSVLVLGLFIFIFPLDRISVPALHTNREFANT